MKRTSSVKAPARPTKEERMFQKETLGKYRRNNTIPSVQTVAMRAAVHPNTVSYFMRGNSFNVLVRDYIRLVITKNLRPIPDDLATLFAIWDRDSQP